MSEYSERIAQQVKALGVSPQGERFLMKALYPPGTETQVSIPDSAWHPTMRVDSRPALSFGVGPGAVVDAPWDACIIAPPGDATAAIIITGPAGTDFSSPTAPANSSVRILSNLSTSFGAGILKSYAASSRVAAGTATEVQRYARSNPMAVSSFRTTYRGITLHNTSSSLYNGGTLIAAQFATGSVDESLVTFARDGLQMYAQMRLFNIPLTDDSLTQMCPGAQAVDAKEGVFMPLRLLGPVQNFVSEASAIGASTLQTTPTSAAENVCSQNVAGTLSSSTSVPSVFVPSYLGGGAPSLTSGPWWLGAANALAGRIDDTGYDHVATGVIFLRNLPYQASFSLQAYIGIEAVLDTSSPFRSLTMATAAYDPKAMQAYYDIVAGMPFTYPASYNALGAILPYISKAISVVAPHLAPFLGSMLRPGAARKKVAIAQRPTRRAATVPQQPPARQRAPVLTAQARRPARSKTPRERRRAPRLRN
nr:MAG: peptidase A21 family protein [Crogonang virus 57]